MAKIITQQEALETLKKLKVEIDKQKFTAKDFTNGMNVELEHGKEDPQTNVTNDDRIMTAKIALRHLKESSKYYQLLDKMEKQFRPEDQTKMAAYMEDLMEKTALNAQKAREMAKQVGLIPEGQWKWALRKLRGPSGGRLTGKELVEAKKKLGSMPNNSKQIIDAVSRENANREVGVNYFNHHFKKDDVYRGDRYGVRMTKYRTNEVDIHTHPNNNLIYGKQEIKRKPFKRLDNLAEGLQSPAKFTLPSIRYNAAERTFNGDIPNMIRTNRNINYKIYSPDNQIEGVHKIRSKKRNEKQVFPWGVRSVFFDRRPRIERNAFSLDGLTEKLAALNDNVQLYLHQQRVVDDPATSKILAHPVGSGKTVTAIAKFEKMKENGQAHKALVVVPASLRDNFGVLGVGKFTNSRYNIIGNKQEISSGTANELDPNADYNIISYEMFKKNPEKYLEESGADTVITDESHRGKNEDTAVTESLKRTRPLYKNYIGLTGSPVSNTIADVQPLVDVAAGGAHNLGESKQEFEEKYLKRSTSPVYKGYHQKRIPVVGFHYKDQLKRELNKYVDYVSPDDVKKLADMPDSDIMIHKVPVSKEQAKIYKGILRRNPAVRRMITTKRLETLKDEEAAKAFSSLIEARKLMNSVGSVKPGISLEDSAKITPKTKAMLDDLEDYLKRDPKGQAILFSHLINGGADVTEAGLRERNIPYGKFIGKGNKGVTEEARQQDVRDYNKHKKKVMLVSSAGGEGISLNDTSWEGVLDPHYNPEKMKQMEARGVRAGGLKNRPEKERVVHINRYLATMPKTLGIFKSPYKTPDEFIYEIAQNKDRQNQLLYNLLKENAQTANKKYLKAQKQKKASLQETQMEKMASLKSSVAKLSDKALQRGIISLSNNVDDFVNSKVTRPVATKLLLQGRKVKNKQLKKLLVDGGRMLGKPQSNLLVALQENIYGSVTPPLKYYVPFR